MSSAKRRSVATWACQSIPFDWPIGERQRFGRTKSSLLFPIAYSSCVRSVLLIVTRSLVPLILGLGYLPTRLPRVSCTVPTHGRISEPLRSSEGGVIEGRLAVRALRRAGGAGVPRAGRRRGDCLWVVWIVKPVSLSSFSAPTPTPVKNRFPWSSKRSEAVLTPLHSGGCWKVGERVEGY